jgi:hypothetical protein
MIFSAKAQSVCKYGDKGDDRDREIIYLISTFPFLQAANCVFAEKQTTGRIVAQTEMIIKRVIQIAVLFLLTCVGFSGAEEAPLKLLKQLSLGPREISRMLKGDIVTKKLETADKRDVAVLGAMLLDVPPVATVDAARDITTFKQGKEILGIDKFVSYDPDELKALTLQEDEIVTLGNCRIRDCDSKLPAGWIEKLRNEKNKQKRIQLFRLLMAEYAKDYSLRGSKAIRNYEGAKHSVPAQKEFENILEHSTYLKRLAPDFYEYLRAYPDKEPPGTENFIYWSREKFGFKPVTNLTHVSMYEWSHADFSGYMIGSRQIFADHYYDASLGLTILIDRKPHGSYLIYINRSRIDMLGGFLSSFRRALTLPRVRSGLELHMKTMKTRIEDKNRKIE